MFKKIIINYINNLTIKNILDFSLKNNINLSTNELNYIYKIIKNDYEILLSDNYKDIFEKSINYIKEDNLKKIYNLYLDYRNKYINLINN